MHNYLSLGSERVKKFLTLMIFALLIFTASIASAQSSQTTLSGTVKDQNGALVPGATITLVDARTKAERQATTNDDGFFLFANVLAGDYRITAEGGGFKKIEVSSVKVDVSIPATVNLVLETGQISETVQTTASDSQTVINTENAELSTVVTEKQINDLPLNGRSPIQLAALQAGVATNSSTRNANINGLRGSYNNITWDGINIQENYLRGNASSGLFAQAGPSVAGVGEFTLTTQNASSADGTGAAQIKLVTPRGGGDYHGSLFEFWRNSALNANTFFNNAAGQPKPYLNQHQFGGNIGGPFALPRFGEGGNVFTQKDKLFFYTYYEETREAQQTLLTRTVLTSPARTGNFTYRRADNGQLQTINVLSLTGRTLDPRISRLIGQTPLPNDLAGDRINTNGFSFNSPSGSNEKLFGFRVNYDQSAKHRFDVVYSRDSVAVPNDAFNNTGEPFPGLPGKGQFPKRTRGAVAWNWVPTQSITNELRGGYYHQSSLFIGDEIQYEGNARLTLPLSLTNPVQNSLTSGRNGKIHELIDNASWVRGNHLFRFGGNFRKTHLEPFNFAGVIPQYTIGFGTNNPNPLSSTNLAQFPGRISTTEFNNASNLLAFLSGAVFSGTQTFNVTSATSGFVDGAEQRRNLIFNLYAAYAADTWRLRPNLTLNFGLRYEYISPVQERDGIGLLPVGGLEALNNPNVQIDLAGGGAGTRPFYNPDRNNFAPNFSFSWDPFKKGKTAVRGGYALSFVIDSVVQMAENAAIDGNQGLTSIPVVNTLSGTVSSGGLTPINEPNFVVPRTLTDQLALTQFPTIFTIDPQLKTPYVQQWNLGFEHEIFPNTAVEVRYVGNRGTKLLRGIDINQVRIFENGFLQDFLRAQQNLTLSTALNATNPAIPASPAFNAAVPGSQALTIFPSIGRRGLFTTAAGTTLDSTIVNLISQGQVGELVNTYVASRNTYLTPGTNGAVLGPAFFLPANPRAGAVDYIGNGSWSTYNALQAEVRRRLNSGLYFQANYTYSKAYTDFEGSDANFSAMLDLGQGGVVEKKRQTNDVTHIFKANTVWELPIGPGKRLFNYDGVVGQILGGWQMNGIFEKRTGRPISFISGRGTLNRSARSTAKNTATTTLSVADLKDSMGIFFDPVTGRPLVIDPRLIGPDGRANAQFFGHPLPGTTGTLHLTPVSGPGFWNFDFSMIKRTKISERMNVEFRAEFFNVFNHTNFFTGENQTITSATFGQVTDTFDPRIVQFALKFNF
jgi:hypothetical protein